jgi:nucleoside-triphosphatase THEP1
MLYELHTQNKNLKIHLENAFDNVEKLSQEIGKLEYFCESFEGKVENVLSHVHQKK